MGFKAMKVARSEEYSGRFTDKDRLGLTGNYHISEHTRNNGEIHNYDVGLNVNMKFMVDETQKDKWKCLDEINKIVEDAVTLIQEQMKKSEYKMIRMAEPRVGGYDEHVDEDAEDRADPVAAPAPHGYAWAENDVAVDF